MLTRAFLAEPGRYLHELPVDAAIGAQPLAAGPATVVRAAARAVAALLQDQLPQLQHRMRIVEATFTLRARDRVKQAGHQQLISERLIERGLRPERARLAGAVGVVCFNEGLARRLTHADRPLREEIDAAFDELATLTSW